MPELSGAQNQGFLESENGVTEYIDSERLNKGNSPPGLGQSDLLGLEEINYSAKDWFYLAIKKRKSIFFEAVVGTFMVVSWPYVGSLYHANTTELCLQTALALYGS